MGRSLDIDQALHSGDLNYALQLISDLTSEEWSQERVMESVVDVYVAQLKVVSKNFSLFCETIRSIPCSLSFESETVVLQIVLEESVNYINVSNKRKVGTLYSDTKQLFSILSSLSFKGRGMDVDQVVRAIYSVFRKRPSLFLLEVLNWWEEIGVNDCSKQPERDGKREIRPLYSRFYELVTRAILNTDQAKGALGEGWRDRVCQFVASYPKAMNVAYALYDLCVRREEIDWGIATQKAFVQSNIGLGWGWVLLAQYHKQLDHQETVFACLCRASLCSMSLMSRWFIWIDMVELAASNAGENVSSWLAYQILQSQEASLSKENISMVHHYQNAAIPCSSKVANEVIKEWAHDAERWLWSDYPTFVGVVSWIDRKAKVVGIVYGVDQRIVVPFSQISFKVDMGQWLRVVGTKEEDINPKLLYIEPSKTLPSGAIFKTVSGRVQQKIGEPFGFVADCFIPPHLMTKRNLQQGEWVELSLVYDIDKRLDKMTWKVVTVEKIDRPSL
ncbi:hypothetical protein K4L44_14695 [Halosquirtibacter laminarini]|uniref:Uncharacterized protein n=1 Tax=Halosquirtibacter laminarini TaxID=3374600 RepID=A0AC61NE33_9BACT|nr:hypothetical protein K4L44_14695 [Prolixibacteraceae bacterium]